MEGKNLFSTGSIIGIAGAVILIIGCFSPVITLPTSGPLTYFGNGNVDGIIILLLSIVSIVLILIRERIFLYITGFVSLCMVSFDLYTMITRIAEINSEHTTGIEQAVMANVQLQWGWALLILGSITLFVSAYYCHKIENALDVDTP